MNQSEVDALALRGQVTCSSCGGTIAPNERRVIMAEGMITQIGCMPCIEKMSAEVQGGQGSAPTDPAPSL